MEKQDNAENLRTRIVKLRGKLVMLDSDLATLYGVSTKRLNEQVKRNIKRFPSDFMFQLSAVEIRFLRSQIATSKTGRGGRRYAPLAFTEQGIAMLSTALTSDRAIQVNIAIMRAFVKLRHAVANSQYLTYKVEKMEGRLHLVETDVRLILDDIGQLKRRFLPEDPIPPTILT